MTANPNLAERRRRDNARRAAAKRAWENANDRPACQKCGAAMGVGSHRKGYTQCGNCRHKATQDRIELVVALRRDGLGNRAIAGQLAISPQAVANLLWRARREGVAVPRDPYMTNRREALRDAA